MKSYLNKTLNKHWLSILAIFSAACYTISSCQKVDNWLDVKSQLNHVRPSTLEDFWALLDEENRMNRFYPVDGLAGSDNYYLTPENFQAAGDLLQNHYTWKKDIYNGIVVADWANRYEVIGRANIVLEGLAKLGTVDDTNFKYIKGTALFFRAINFYNLAQSYSLPFSNENKSLPGIVLRLTSDVNVPSVRSSIEETYQQIIRDISLAIDLLPLSSGYQTRPNKAAALILLAKTYLVMGDYEHALQRSDQCLSLSDGLLDYNSNLIKPSSTYRFPAFPGNPEVQFFARGTSNRSIGPQTNAYGYVDSLLYQSYDVNDLRKSLIYNNSGNGKVQFRGSYTGENTIFAGLATNEAYLIRMECAARLGNIKQALADLNHLLINRYRKGTFLPYQIDDKDALLRLILLERRKELPFTAQIRWEDLRRLNLQAEFAKTLIRKISGITYELPPNDKRYALPIPDKEIQLSGIPQNER